jgi:small subunit ribosomal protein S9
VLRLAKKKTSIHGIGKRKRAIARAYAKPGKGKVFINKKLLDIVKPDMIRMFIKEPIILAGNVPKKIDIDVRVKGGGIWGQATAARQAIAEALVEYDKDLKEKFLNYDRSLLKSDPRRTEPHKPSRSRAGPRRHKQRSKR